MTTLNHLPKFSVRYEYSKIESELLTFSTLVEAQAEYNKIAGNILWQTERLEASHWRNNREGLSVELCELKEIPVKDTERLKDAESEDEVNELWNDILFTYSERILTKSTYLSDEWDEEKNEFIIKENEVEGATYGTYFGAKPDCISVKEL